MASAYQIIFLLAAASLVLVLKVGGTHRFEDCEYDIVESMPEGINLPKLAAASVKLTHESLMEIVQSAQTSVRIATFYLSLTPEEKLSDDPSTMPGQMVLDTIIGAARRGLDIEILIDNSNSRDMNSQEDIDSLKEAGISIKRLNMRKLLGGGVMHSKFLIADNETFYVGSSNLDWRSYTQIKEIGVVFKQCPTLAKDLDKIYRTYALLTRADVVPQTMTKDLRASTNLTYPLWIDDFKVSLTGAPPAFNGNTGRTDDIAGLLHIIGKATRKIDISVMDYNTKFEFSKVKEHWPIIDTALRRAVNERKVRVRLLVSTWNKSMESVKALKNAGIHVKVFEVPAFDDFQKSIPFARVKHDKFMVTDQGLYIGTSNWSPDYFENTCGVSVVMESGDHGTPKIVKAMQELFERDFSSEYAHELE